jgi:hypothetical protein
MNYTKYENEIEQGLKETYRGKFKAKINPEFNSLMIYFDKEDLKENTKFSENYKRLEEIIEELNLGGYGCEYLEVV